MELSQFIKEAVLEAVKGIEESRKENESVDKGLGEQAEIGPVKIKVKASIVEDEGKIATGYAEGCSSVEFTIPVKLNINK